MSVPSSPSASASSSGAMPKFERYQRQSLPDTCPKCSGELKDPFFVPVAVCEQGAQYERWCQGCAARHAPLEAGEPESRAGMAPCPPEVATTTPATTPGPDSPSSLRTELSHAAHKSASALIEEVRASTSSSLIEDHAHVPESLISLAKRFVASRLSRQGWL